MSEQLVQLARDWAQNAIHDGLGYVARETLEQFALTVATAATADLRREVEQLTTGLDGARGSLKSYERFQTAYEQLAPDYQKLRVILSDEVKDGRPDALPCDCAACKRYDAIQSALTSTSELMTREQYLERKKAK